jgi:fibronectin-binding autotransporter adhesin
MKNRKTLIRAARGILTQGVAVASDRLATITGTGKHPLNRSFFIGAAFAILAVAPHAANAQNLSWSPTAENSGGPGTWDTVPSHLTWFNGTITLPWDNTAGTSANFGGIAGTVTLAEPITVQNITFATDGYTITGDQLTFFGAASTITTSGGLDTINSVLGGAGALIKAGPGTLTGTNTYAGGTTFTGGVLSIASDANLGAATGNHTFNGGTLLTTAPVTSARSISLPGNGTIDNGGSADTFSGTITGVGALTFTGAGTTTLSGTNTYTGGTTITGGGTVHISSDANLGAATGPLTLNSGTLATTSNITTTRPVTVGVGGATFDVAPPTTFTIGSTLLGSGPITKIDTGTLSLGGANNFAGAIAINAGTLQFSNPSGLNSTYSGVISGPGAILQSGAGITTLSGINTTYTGSTSVAGGILQFSNDANLGTGPVSISNGATLRATTTVTSTRPITLVSGTDNISVTSGTLTLGGVIDGAGQLTKTDGGILTLTGTNTYTGGTTIVGGTLSISSDTSLGTAGTLTLSGGTLATTANITTATAVSTTANSTINVAAGTTLNLTGTLIGANTITKANTTGTLELSGPNTGVSGTGFTGAMSINGGTLAFNPASGTTVTYTGAISNVGAVAQVGAGTTILSGSNSWTGGTTISAGTLQIGNNPTTNQSAGAISATGAIANNASLVFNTTTALSLSGVISGAGTLTQETGSLTLAAGTTNTYTGPTNVTGGALFVNANNTGTGLVTVSSGATLGGSGTIGGSVDMTLGGTLIPAPSVLPPAPGTAVTAGTLTIGGNLTLSSGTTLNYALGAAGPFPAGPPIPGGSLNSLIAVGGHLTLAGSLNVLQTTGGSFSPGVYALFTYGSLTGNNSSLTIASAPAPLSALSISTTLTAGQVDLVYAPPVFPMLFWNGSTTSQPPVGVQGGNGTWQGPTGTTNWTNSTGTTSSPWADNGFAIFAGTPGTVMVNNTIAGPVNFTGAQFMVGNASNFYLVTGAPLTIVINNTEINVGDGTPTGASITATINSVIQGTGTQFTGGINKTGLGTLVLTGANNYTSGTTISAGTLQIGNGGSTGSVPGNIVDNAALVFNLGTAAPAATRIFSGIVSGSGSLTQEGAGTIVLTGSNTYTGGTIINAGSTLQIGNGTTGSILSPSVTNPTATITDNGTLAFNVNTNPTYTGISGNGSVAILGGTVTLGGMNTYLGGTTLSGGTLNVSDDTNLGNESGSFTISGGTFIPSASFTMSRPIVLAGTPSGSGTFNPPSTPAPGITLTLSGPISGAGRLTTFSGTTVLTNATNSYTGGTFVQNSTLQISSDANLGGAASTTGIITFNNGTLITLAPVTSARGIMIGASGTANTGTINNGGNIDTFSGVISSGATSGVGGPLTFTGAGTTILSGANTYTGPTAVGDNPWHGRAHQAGYRHIDPDWRQHLHRRHDHQRRNPPTRQWRNDWKHCWERHRQRDISIQPRQRYNDLRWYNRR